ncbi:transposable element Tcb2 transposase [Trichonephila clavipes]|nr:transposable element Tcb2 transposase [Trichonephila clavipes]
MIGKLEEGRSLSYVIEGFGITKSVVSLAWKAFQTMGRVVRKVGDGLPRKITAEDDLYTNLHVKRAQDRPDFVFMDDNAWPHRTVDVQQLLESEDITRMDWPALSPDLNSIEDAWVALGTRLAARLHPPRNTKQPKQVLIEE